MRRVGNSPEPSVNGPAGAGCRGTPWVTRRIPSCPTINAGCSAPRKLSGIGQECLPHSGAHAGEIGAALAHLLAPHGVIKSLISQQVGMAAELHDAPALQHGGSEEHTAE